MDQEMKTITEVSRSFGVSTRMLRHYEKIGLLESCRVEGYSYRMYSEQDLQRLQQILILRKLRLSLKDIGIVLQNPEAVNALEVFRKNIIELDNDMQALSTIRSILLRLTAHLQVATDMPLQNILTSDDDVLLALDSLSLSPIDFKENQTMNKLQQANSQLSKPLDIRIITLPPATVAASHFVGDEPEIKSRQELDAFVKKYRLWETKPDLRQYGFNHPNPKDETGYHGYERWVTIPDDMEVPTPLEKKHFAGGLYAAHAISIPDFNDFEEMLKWVMESDTYEFAGDFADQDHMCGLLDEHLNYVAHVQLEETEPRDVQFDLLMPIRER